MSDNCVRCGGINENIGNLCVSCIDTRTLKKMKYELARAYLLVGEDMQKHHAWVQSPQGLIDIADAIERELEAER